MSDAAATLHKTVERMEARALAYQRIYSWPACVDPSNGALMLALHADLDAITVPAELGVRTQRVLCLRMLAGPVLLLPTGSGTTGPDWLFLTGPAQALRHRTIVELGRIGARFHQRSTFVPLPPTRVNGSEVRWSTSPVSGRELPPWAAVIAALRSAALGCTQ
ncbi:hypothetical protein GCM10010174_73840 [Kutzneria viridogrisea]|uniref:Uncharacterized protein n=2 Tax=Kutzneria TaxID=43356 RepID=W5W7P0_9PSEU|nr:hypothetical protein [Kutzneria albida]AHH96957.1 hypothetical protein KALB_3593 [Kutzneria albida DSM 43870]MBA8932078.1 hypothetical protein [Kutzneria viridogrisea]